MAIMLSLLSFSVEPLSADCDIDSMAGHTAGCEGWPDFYNSHNREIACLYCMGQLLDSCLAAGTSTNQDQRETETLKCYRHVPGLPHKNKKSAK